MPTFPKIMHANDFFKDDKGQTYRVGTPLGRGLFAKSYTVRSDDGLEWVAKISLQTQDFPTGKEHLAQISRQILQEQWIEVSGIQHPNILRPHTHFISDKGHYCVLYPRNDQNFDNYLQRDHSIPDLLRLAIQLAQILPTLPKRFFPHGNIHGGNVFIQHQHRRHILIMDALTPLLRTHYQELLQCRDSIPAHVPPEHRIHTIKSNTTKSNDDWNPKITADTYAISLFLLQYILGVETAKQVSLSGMDKKIEDALERRIVQLLEQNPTANPHFISRVGRSLLRLLSRALHQNMAPSPPFRFPSIVEFQERLQDIVDAVNPTIAQLGKIIFKSPPGQTDFYTNQSIEFSCLIKTTPNLEDHEDVHCGTMIIDIDKNQQIKSYNSSVDVSRNPSGKLRFALQIDGLPPGNYIVRLGFLIKDSISPHKQVESTFRVFPVAGYSPAIESPNNSLAFPKQSNATNVHVFPHPSASTSSPIQGNLSTLELYIPETRESFSDNIPATPISAHLEERVHTLDINIHENVDNDEPMDTSPATIIRVDKKMVETPAQTPSLKSKKHNKPNIIITDPNIVPIHLNEPDTEFPSEDESSSSSVQKIEQQLGQIHPPIEKNPAPLITIVPTAPTRSITLQHPHTHSPFVVEIEKLAETEIRRSISSPYEKNTNAESDITFRDMSEDEDIEASSAMEDSESVESTDYSLEDSMELTNAPLKSTVSAASTVSTSKPQKTIHAPSSKQQPPKKAQPKSEEDSEDEQYDLIASNLQSLLKMIKEDYFVTSVMALGGIIVILGVLFLLL